MSYKIYEGRQLIRHALIRIIIAIMIKRILLPLDGSDFAVDALPYAEMLVEKFSAELILMRAADRHPALAYDADPRGYSDLIIQQNTHALI